MTLNERLTRFNEHFNYKEQPELYEFEISPEKIAYRNEALRTGDRELYFKYLSEKYEDKIKKEMESFDLSAKNLVKIDKKAAENIFDVYQINLLKSDISFLDDDAIYSMYKVNPETIDILLESYRDDVIDGFVPPREVFYNGRKEIYLDKSGVFSN